MLAYLPNSEKLENAYNPTRIATYDADENTQLALSQFHAFCEFGRWDTAESFRLYLLPESTCLGL